VGDHGLHAVSASGVSDICLMKKLFKKLARREPLKRGWVDTGWGHDHRAALGAPSSLGCGVPGRPRTGESRRTTEQVHHFSH